MRTAHREVKSRRAAKRIVMALAADFRICRFGKASDGQ